MDNEQPGANRARAAARSRAGRPRLGSETGREAILSCALQYFARRGYDGVNIRDLAKQAGVNIALANYHFGSKAALWEACLERLRLSAADVLADMTSLTQTALPFPQKLARIYAAFIRFNAGQPDYGLFVLQEMLQPGERQELVKNLLVDPFQAIITPLLLQGKELGVILSGDVQLLFFTHSIAISHVLAGQGLVAPFLTPESRREETLKELLSTMIRSATGSLPGEFEQAIEAASRSVF